MIEYTKSAVRHVFVAAPLAFAGVFALPCDFAAAQGTGADGDDFTIVSPPPRTAPPTTQSVVPKSIYLTPKGDRLRSSKGHRFRKAPKPPPDDPEVELEPEIEDVTLPEISIPFDPHAGQPAQVAGPVPRTKPPIEIKGRPIDISFRNGQLVLNRFHTLRVDMLHDECRKFPAFIVADYDLPKNSIDILADNLMIVQKRLCAKNGSIVVTCYQNAATISLRRLRPDDGCRN